LFDEYVVDTEENYYIMPEFFFNQEVALLSKDTSSLEHSEYVFSTTNVVRLLEDKYFQTHPTLRYGVKGAAHLVTFKSLLLYTIIS
jgi:hypothetical protein